MPKRHVWIVERRTKETEWEPTELNHSTREHARQLARERTDLARKIYHTTNVFRYRVRRYDARD